MTHHIESRLIVTLLMLAATAAYSMTEAEYEATIARAKADYKSTVSHCKTLKGNDKDVCIKEAKATRVKAETDTASIYKGTVDSKVDAMEQQAKANYKAAIERCDSLSGDAKKACRKEAKAANGQ
jgi:hypothetical protein